MKGYYTKRELRLTGKAWEVRAKLRQLSKQAEPSITLQEWLTNRAKASMAGVNADTPAPSRAPAFSIADYRSYPMV